MTTITRASARAIALLSFALAAPASADGVFTFVQGPGAQTSSGLAGLDNTVNTDVNFTVPTAQFVLEAVAPPGRVTSEVRPIRVESKTELTTAPNQLAFANATAYVAVTEATPITIVWTWEGGNAGPFTAAVSSFTPPNSHTVLAGIRQASPAAPGTASFTLMPGTTYRLETAVSTSANAAASARITIDGAADACPCDIDLSGDLSLDDIEAFVTAFLAQSPSADCDGSGAISADDIDCFVACFLAGCP